METIQLLNSNSTDDIMEKQQHEEEPKGFRSLPRELRDKIYKLVLLPEPRCITHCSVEGFGGAHLASTHQSAETQSLCMDTNLIRSRAWSRGQQMPRLLRTASILLACRQIFQEASQVLYENTQLQLETEHWPGSGTKFSEFSQILSGCQPDALRHIRVLSLVFPMLTRDQFILHPLDLCIDRSRLPGLKLLKLHFDLHGDAPPDATRFECLYAVADHVEFVVDFHIYSFFLDDGTGWGEAVFDGFSTREENPVTNASAWAAAKERAIQMRATFVKELGAVFQQYGKELKIKAE